MDNNYCITKYRETLYERSPISQKQYMLKGNDISHALNSITQHGVKCCFIHEQNETDNSKRNLIVENHLSTIKLSPKSKEEEIKDSLKH